jgi:hypothetical protein
MRIREDLLLTFRNRIVASGCPALVGARWMANLPGNHLRLLCFYRISIPNDDNVAGLHIGQ